jgi:hypothetical protein
LFIEDPQGIEAGKPTGLEAGRQKILVKIYLTTIPRGSRELKLRVNLKN